MNKYTTILITILFFLCSCDNSSGIEENNDELMTNQKDLIGIEKDQNNKLIMISSGSVQPYQEIKLYNADFTVVLNKNGDTTYWSTNDNEFETPEGFKVGTTWKELPLELQASLSQVPGWAYYIKLNSGWKLGFCEGNSCTDSKPKDDSNVKWIFKRDD